jgi:hypothetical protein
VGGERSYWEWVREQCWEKYHEYVEKVIVDCTSPLSFREFSKLCSFDRADKVTFAAVASEFMAICGIR